MIDFNKDRVLHYFNKISEIPRESGNEKTISDWITQWASDLGLEVKQDALLNVVIQKKAALGYEPYEPVLLQAHMDMVCEKTLESNHDFLKDPIKLKEDGDWISSACGTSLGADNGIGVACAMAVLEDKTLKHPAIEVAFTVEEETTFGGAEGMSKDMFLSKRMLNLDHAVDSEIIAGSCGGTGLHFNMPLKREERIPKGHEAYLVKICGLKGGHSGEDIHRGRGNAISLLIRLLNKGQFKVVNISGGTNRLAIPREAEAVLLTDDEEYLRKHISMMKSEFLKEYRGSAPELDITYENAKSQNPLTDLSMERIIAAVKLFPNGIINMSGEFEGVVESSDNLGVIEVSENNMLITAEVRGLYQSSVDDIVDKVKVLAKMTGSEVDFFAGYVPWEYTQESVLRNTAKDVYREMFGSEMKELIIHAGLECGMFAAKDPRMDIIAIGPNCQFFHSPNERVSISSVKKFYSFLVQLLSKLN